jgi:Starch-binding associating with outer membrane
MTLKKIAAIVLVGASLAGCSKSWIDVNTNPNTLPTSTPDFVFSNALTRMTVGSLNPNELGSYWSGQWTQSNSYILSPTIFAYLFTNTDFNYWDTWYDILSDFNFAEQQAPLTNQMAFAGPSKVMKAYIFQQIVDAYGNAPYSQALQGGANLFPEFDSQQDIYEGLIKDLDTAITLIKANPFSGANIPLDVAFKGNTTKWIQFANSLKLRILIRQSKITGRDAYIIAEINKAAAVTEGFLPASLDVTVNPGWLATAGKTNPMYDRWAYDPNGALRALARYPRPTRFLYDVLVATDDTFRLKRIAYAKGGENPSTPGVSAQSENVSNYVFVPFGVASGYTAPASSYIGPSQFIKGKYDKPYYLFTASESFFLLAEAKQRYGAAVNLPKTAQEYYEAGVIESFRLTGTALSAATTLLTSGKNEADWNASADKLKAIWMQKWIALTNFGGFEAWCEYRRTNYPNTPPSLSTTITQPRPLRLFYSATEVGSNTANVNAQGNIDVFSNKLFWDVD